MKVSDFFKLRSKGIVNIPTTNEGNSFISLTDPTQACPVQAIYNAILNGRPLDVSEHQNVFNGVKVDDLSSIEKRHHDRFDVAIEAKKIGKKFSKVAKMVVPPSEEDKK